MTDNIASRLGLAQRVIPTPSKDLTDSLRNVGIEIEVEDISRSSLQEEQGNLWEVVPDGSLRPTGASGELRLPTPGRCGKQLIEALDSADQSPILNRASFSWRCAVHVHVDMRDKTPEDILMAMTLYSLLEPYFFAWDGTGRQESRFCMPWWVCSQDMITASNIANSRNNSEFTQQIGVFSKYTALNLAPLRRLGTIEFRHMRSTNKKRRLLEYTNMCLDVVSISEKAGKLKPIDLVSQFMQVGYTQFIRQWMSDQSANALLDVSVGESPLTPAILDRVINTALTLAELHKLSSLATPISPDIKTLTAITKGD